MAQTVADWIRANRLAGRPLCIHASMRAHTPRVPADDIIAVMLEAGITLLVPVFTYDLESSPPPAADLRPARNGMDYEAVNHRVAPTFDASSNELSLADMGAFPAAVLQTPGRVRGHHPLNSFAAIGPLAEQLVAGQRPTDVYAPFRELLALDGGVLMIGTGLTSMTLIHHAEAKAGRALFIRWANIAGEPHAPCHVGSCSAGFDRLAPWTADLAREEQVNGATWSLYEAAPLTERLVEVITAEPEITRCNNPGCWRCADAINGGPQPLSTAR